MPESYLPARESDLDRWAATFQNHVVANPTSFGLTSAQATTLTTLVTDWHNAFVITSDNATRTPAAIQTKNDAKQAMLSKSIACLAGGATRCLIGKGPGPWQHRHHKQGQPCCNAQCA